MTTTIDLDELTRLHEAATPGPWRKYRDRLRAQFPATIIEVQCAEETAICAWAGFDDSNRTKKDHEANAALIAASRNALPALIAAARERDELAKWRLHHEDELNHISAAIGTMEFIDPPDGGDVSLAIQVKRMKDALDDTRRECEAIAAREASVVKTAFELQDKNAALTSALRKCVEALKPLHTAPFIAGAFSRGELSDDDFRAARSAISEARSAITAAKPLIEETKG